MVKKSENSLKNWVSDIINLQSKIKYLEEKLEYAYVRFYGVSSPVYDKIGSSCPNPFNDGMFYWLERINEIENKIASAKDEITKFNDFRKTLTSKQMIIFDMYYVQGFKIVNIASILNISVNVIYAHLSSIKLLFKLNGVNFD